MKLADLPWSDDLLGPLHQAFVIEIITVEWDLILEEAEERLEKDHERPIELPN